MNYEWRLAATEARGHSEVISSLSDNLDGICADFHSMIPPLL